VDEQGRKHEQVSLDRARFPVRSLIGFLHYQHDAAGARRLHPAFLPRPCSPEPSSLAPPRQVIPSHAIQASFLQGDLCRLFFFSMARTRANHSILTGVTSAVNVVSVVPLF